MSHELNVVAKESIFLALAKQWGVEEINPPALYKTLKATAFKPIKRGDGYLDPTEEQTMALCIVSKQYNLNPFLKQIYAFPAKDGSIIPVVGVDGWANIINSHPEMNGLEYRYSEETVLLEGAKPCSEWIECIISRKDREKPVVVREYLDECYQKSKYGSDGAWQTHTKRCLRHKATIQCGRMAFGFSGIYDQDEAENILKDVTPNTPTKLESIASVTSLINSGTPPQTIINNDAQAHTLVQPTIIKGQGINWERFTNDLHEVIDKASDKETRLKIFDQHKDVLLKLREKDAGSYSLLEQAVNQ